jgi:hypothetical protein
MEIEEQHPIPQQVSSYQFKLVGDMTLQQFFQVAGGALVALLFYSSGLPAYVKWPLIVFSFLIGIALAFFPLQDRPLAKWIVLFIKAIYSPTLYVWKQRSAKYPYFLAEPAAKATDVQIQPPQDTTPLPLESANLENQEKKFLDKVTKDLSGVQTQTIPSVPVGGIVQTTTDVKPKVKESQVQIPKTEKVDVEPTEKPQTATATNTGQNVLQTQSFKLTPSAGQIAQNTQGAKFSSEAAPPLPPTKPNVIVGQVVDPEGKIVENAILEIRDSEGRPARALRSNKLGHFMIVTPLADGNYQIITEKDGLNFDTISLDVKGEIIPPLAIWAKGKTQNETPESIKV